MHQLPKCQLCMESRDVRPEEQVKVDFVRVAEMLWWVNLVWGSFCEMQQHLQPSTSLSISNDISASASACCINRLSNCSHAGNVRLVSVCPPSVCFMDSFQLLSITSANAKPTRPTKWKPYLVHLMIYLVVVRNNHRSAQQQFLQFQHPRKETKDFPHTEQQQSGWWYWMSSMSRDYHTACVAWIKTFTSFENDYSFCNRFYHSGSII